MKHLSVGSIRVAPTLSELEAPAEKRLKAGELALVEIDAGPLGQFRLEIEVRPAGNNPFAPDADTLGVEVWRVDPKKPASGSDPEYGEPPLGEYGDPEGEGDAGPEGEDDGPLVVDEGDEDDDEDEDEDEEGGEGEGEEEEDLSEGAPPVLFWAWEPRVGLLLKHPKEKGKTYCPRGCEVKLWPATAHPPGTACPTCVALDGAPITNPNPFSEDQD